jgi:hypothetical protein
MGNKDRGGKKKESKKAGKTDEKAKTTTKPTAQETTPQVAEVTTTKSSDSHASRVIRCDCNHAFQDKTYGVGMRVHTPKKTGGWRCTVCRKEH